MATIVLSAVGAAAGASIGGGVLGLSSVVIGRAIGATVGRVIDQRILGSGSRAIETGKVDRFRLTGASEGAPVGVIYGRARLAGQVIWASQFLETVRTSGGSGKGTPSAPSTTEYSYSVSLAIAVGEGETSRIGRIWADGAELAPDGLNLRFYPGTEDQMPDPKIEAVEGIGQAPAYRGIAYVVIEDLPLAQFGNRVPQFNFEIVRPAPETGAAAIDLSRGVRGVSLVPGTGEYALATTPVSFNEGLGVNRRINVNSPSGQTDFRTSLDALRGELPNCNATSLVVSWFGDDLRCGSCQIQPKVEQAAIDGTEMPWSVSGLTRQTAGTVQTRDGRPVYGGTPTDQSVVEAITALRANGGEAVFYPFVLMEILDGNARPDPWSNAPDQPALPWRGRITTEKAPGQVGTTDQTAAADAEVAAFFGQAAVSDFTVTASGVSYSGPAEMSYRRFILHYAHLCAAAGGVEGFCIGSEMRGLTQIRGAGNSFPAVAALRQLAADIRAVLGPQTKIGYAADWSEYFGYHPQDGTGDVFFHLDPLWADPAIDFVGIDNYMPLSDWRDGFDHADADWGAIYSLDYLKSNIDGGEGYDWYYHAPEAQEIQLRTPISDGAHGEDWVFRYKDLKSWWSQEHFNRTGGQRDTQPTAWQPESKPIWFTELGCAAINKGSNEPNKFLDPKSSESGVPKYSNGTRDDLIQMQFLRAHFDFWADPAKNPVSTAYGGPMVDPARIFVWAWDARPYPYFPNATNLWSDGDNYTTGHWLNGRSTSRSLASVVAEICERSGVTGYDVSALYGIVRGYTVQDVIDARAALQPLMIAYGFDAIERDGQLVFRNRDGNPVGPIDRERLAVSADIGADLQKTRAASADISGRLRLNFIEADGDYETRAAEAVFPDTVSSSVAQSELPLVLTQAEGRAIVERWLAEARVARETVRFALPFSRLDLGAGDVVEIDDGAAVSAYRIDRAEQAELALIEAVKVEAELYVPSDSVAGAVQPRPFVPAAPVFPVFLDLPLITGDEVPQAPHIAVTATPWPGAVAVYASASESGYELNRLINGSAIIGETLTPLFDAKAGIIDRGAALRVKVYGGALSSVTDDAMLNGANAAAIGDGMSDIWEVFQFRDAALVAPDTYDLALRLRGQLGTDALIPADWPAGSRFVLLDGSVAQIDLASSVRGLSRNYRIGPANRAFDDPVYVQQARAFDGIGLRPYAPVHLRAMRLISGDLDVRWIRRTRIDGDGWTSLDVPLGEASESYLVRVVANGSILREAIVAAPQWSYAQSAQQTDGATGPFSIQVAQISEKFGPGLFRRIDIDD